MFPKIRFEFLCAPRRDGGLGVLSPPRQQLSLQWYWLAPILCSSNQPSPATPYLRQMLSILHPSTDPLMPLLFPASRPTGSDPQSTNVSLLFRTMDAIPRDFLRCTPSAATCLALPLSLIEVPFFPGRRLKPSPGLKKLVVGDVFLFDHMTNTIRRRLPQEVPRSPNLVRRFTRTRPTRHAPRAFLLASLPTLPVYRSTYTRCRGRFPFPQWPWETYNEIATLRPADREAIPRGHSLLLSRTTIQSIDHPIRPPEAMLNTVPATHGSAFCITGFPPDLSSTSSTRQPFLMPPAQCATIPLKLASILLSSVRASGPSGTKSGPTTLFPLLQKPKPWMLCAFNAYRS